MYLFSLSLSLLPSLPPHKSIKLPRKMARADAKEWILGRIDDLIRSQPDKFYTAEDGQKIKDSIIEIRKEIEDKITIPEGGETQRDLRIRAFAQKLDASLEKELKRNIEHHGEDFTYLHLNLANDVIDHFTPKLNALGIEVEKVPGRYHGYPPEIHYYLSGRPEPGVTGKFADMVNEVMDKRAAVLAKYGFVEKRPRVMASSQEDPDGSTQVVEKGVEEMQLVKKDDDDVTMMSAQ
jgi:hypothetical protein